MPCCALRSSIFGWYFTNTTWVHSPSIFRSSSKISPQTAWLFTQVLSIMTCSLKSFLGTTFISRVKPLHSAGVESVTGTALIGIVVFLCFYFVPLFGTSLLHIGFNLYVQNRVKRFQKTLLPGLPGSALRLD